MIKAGYLKDSPKIRNGLIIVVLTYLLLIVLGDMGVPYLKDFNTGRKANFFNWDDWKAKWYYQILNILALIAVLVSLYGALGLPTISSESKSSVYASSYY